MVKYLILNVYLLEFISQFFLIPLPAFTEPKGYLIKISPTIKQIINISIPLIF